METSTYVGELVAFYLAGKQYYKYIIPIMYGKIEARQWFYQYNIEGSRRIVKHEC